MTDLSAIMMAVHFCFAGYVGPEQKCAEPMREVRVHILYGQVNKADCPAPTPNMIAFCTPRFSKLDAIIKILDGERALFVLKPDGSSEHASDFSPDDAAKVFWLALSKYFPGIAGIGSMP